MKKQSSPRPTPSSKTSSRNHIVLAPKKIGQEPKQAPSPITLIEKEWADQGKVTTDEKSAIDALLDAAKALPASLCLEVHGEALIVYKRVIGMNGELIGGVGVGSLRRKSLNASLLQKSHRKTHCTTAQA